MKLSGGRQVESGDFATFSAPVRDAQLQLLLATGVVTDISPGHAIVQFRLAAHGGTLSPGIPVEILHETATIIDEPHPPADGMVLIAPDLVVAQGSRVLVPVRLLRAHDVLNMDFQLSYQPEVATALSDPQRGSLIMNLSQNNLVQPGLFKFNFAQLSPINGDGSVAGFRFDATGAAGSRTPLTLEVHTVNNSQGVRLPIRVVNGSITIYDPHKPPGATDPKIPGGSHPPGPPGGTTGGGTQPAWQPTCSGSGVQTMNDALCCLKMWVGLTPRGLFMDLDNNNEVDSRDAVIVMQNVGRTIRAGGQ